MSKTRITKWDFFVRKSYYKFMRQRAVLANLEAMGGRIAAAAGDGVTVDSEASSGRRGTPRVGVSTSTYEAMRAEAKDRALTRALDAGRG